MDAAIRKKRSNEGSRRSELEAQLADLRDQEAELVRAIELVLEYESTGKGIGDVGTPILTERPTAEEKDYELKLKHVTEAHKRRNKLFWTDVRKVITSLLNHKPVKSVFGVAVRDTPWGGVPKNWEQYTKVISKPMDLNTIKQKLGDEDNPPRYKSPHEVAEDVRLIVDNCLVFNSDPQNEPVRKIADTLSQMFDKKWRDGAFEQRWQKDRAQERMDYEELSDLQAAAKGTTADKIRYFDNCVRRRLQDLQTGEPTSGKPFTWEQKRKLSLACSKLSDEHCQKLMDIIAKSPDMPPAQDGEVVLDIGTLPDTVLYSMQKFVDNAPKLEVHARPNLAAAPSERTQVISEAPAAQPVSAAAPVSSRVAPRVAEASAPAAPAAERDAAAAAVAPVEVNDWSKAAEQPREGGQAEQRKDESAGPAANGRSDPQASTGVSGGSRESSSSSSGSSSSSDDDDGKSDRSSNSSGQGKNGSPDSQQGESNHGPGSGKASIEENEKRTSADVGETVVVSRNVPIGGEKSAPAILKAKDDAKEIQIENEDDWAVPADDDENDETQAMDAEDTPQAPPEDGSNAQQAEEIKGD